MFVTETTKFKCPYCSREYERIVGHGTFYKYKGKRYEDERCPHCNETFLYGNGEFIKMPDDKNELQWDGCWMS